MSASVASEVVVVTGAGGMGLAISRRLGSGRRIVLADFDATVLAGAGEVLRGEGHDVTEVPIDVSDGDQVAALAARSAGMGRLTSVVHTAGVSPVQAGPGRIVAVDIVGTAHVLDAFLEHAVAGMAVICIASMAGSMFTLSPEAEQALAATPTAHLSGLPLLDAGSLDSGSAYAIAKRANQLRVQAAATAYGRKGARVLSISPGVIATPMGRAELDGPTGQIMRSMVESSATGRLGTPDDIADAVAFLAGPGASFITGTDLLVDGGVVAATRYGSSA